MNIIVTPNSRHTTTLHSSRTRQDGGLGPDYGPMPSGYDEYRTAQFASRHDPAHTSNI
jgi:hypothetical protein